MSLRQLELGQEEMNLKLLLLIGLLAVQAVMGFLHSASVRLPSAPSVRCSALQFQKRSGEDDGNDKGNKQGGGGEDEGTGLLRFLPRILRARLQKSFSTPEQDTGNRYHLRIFAPQKGPEMRRHTITRLVRFLDLEYDTAADIVRVAYEKEKALARVMTSLDSAMEVKRQLLSADPPVPCEVYDARTNQIVV